MGHVHQAQFGILALDGMAQRAGDQVAVALPLDEVILGAFLHDFDGGGFVVERAQYDDGDLLADRLDAADRRQGVGIGHRDVGQHDIVAPLFELEDRLVDAADMGELEAVHVDLGQQLLDQPDIVRIVFYEQDFYLI